MLISLRIIILVLITYQVMLSDSLSASTGGPAIIEADLKGDIESTTENFNSTPGSGIWNGLSGYLISNPYLLKDDQGRTHIFVKGGDGGLWDNIDGDWQGLGGFIASDPFALKDDQGKIHVFVKGGDSALWDRVLDGGWTNLGGYITSNPSAALSADNKIKIVARGGDNSLWLKDMNTGSWSSLGGYIDSNPQVIFDKDGKMHALAKGGDGAVWDNVDGTWQYLGGYITSDPRSIRSQFNPGIIYTQVRGGDGALWLNALDTSSKTSTWTSLGGVISPSSGDVYKANPTPVVDAEGVIHTFVRGDDGALWDNANGNWYNLGGSITSDPSASRDNDVRLIIAARGADNQLWVNTLGISQPAILVCSEGCDYTKIQSAVDAANTGSLIKVLSGTYNENIWIKAKSLKIQGSGIDKTIVNGNQLGSVFITSWWGNPNTDITLSDMTITGGSGALNEDNARYGGGINNDAMLKLENCKVSGNTATYGGGILNFGTLDLNGGTTINGNHASYGSGINNQNIVNLNGGAISSNIAISGGGIWNGATVNMNGGSIDHNEGSDMGGGIFGYGGTLNLRGGSIDHNYAGNHGGGGILNHGTLYLNGCSISFNTALNEGGGIQNFLGDVTMNSGSISSNTAKYGGGIHNYGTVTMTGGSIDHNSAIYVQAGGADGGYGGGIFSVNLVNLDGGIIAYNTAKYLGGGILNGEWTDDTSGYVYHGTVNLNTGSIDHNIVTENSLPSGGGIFNVKGETLNGNLNLVQDNHRVDLNGPIDNIYLQP